MPDIKRLRSCEAIAKDVKIAALLYELPTAAVTPLQTGRATLIPFSYCLLMRPVGAVCCLDTWDWSVADLAAAVLCERPITAR